MNMLEINKRGVILTVIILASICYILYSNGDEINPDSKGQSDTQEGEDGLGLGEIPNIADGDEGDAYPEIGHEVEYVEDYVDVDGMKIFYVHARSTVKPEETPRFAVLLLHGAAFQAETWKSLGTLQFIARSGYFPIAVDLPGFGKTNANKFQGDEAKFMGDLIAALPDTERPVIVTPSMSGRFSLPFIFEHQSEVRGFVPIAPVNRYKEKDYEKLSVPALVVYGALDAKGEETSEIIGHAPKSKILKIPNGEHPAYLTDPALFHSEVKVFLDGLYASEMTGRKST